jgi:hypothetical protein
MYDSLAKHCNNFHLFIFPFDNKCLEILNKLKLNEATIIPLDDFENEELIRIKNTRTKKEYCWTCTPLIILYVLEHFGVENCTYIDADLYFYSSPDILINEMQNKSVLITEHRYSKKNDFSKTSGKYCVQFLTFKNNSLGLRVLKYWKDACIEWCFARSEDGKFGDQKYLDDWISRFDCIYELNNVGGGVAPWNVQQYQIINKKNVLYIKEKKNKKLSKLVFYHFHGLVFYKNNTIELTNPTYLLSKRVMKYIYKPYIEKLEHFKQNLKQIGYSIEENEIVETTNKKPLTFKYIFYIYLKEIAKAILGITLREKIKPQKNIFLKSK